MGILEKYKYIDYPGVKVKEEAARKRSRSPLANWLTDIFFPIIKPQIEKNYSELSSFLKEEYEDIAERILDRRIKMARRDMVELLERIKKASDQDEIKLMLQEEKFLRDKIQTLEVVSSAYKTEMLILQRVIESRLMKSLNSYNI